MQIEGKVVLITGASSGIGRALAVNLSAKGAHLALLARREEELRKLAAELAPSNPEVLVIPADVTNREGVQAAVRQTVERFGRLDVLVNNAGFGYFGSLEKMPPGDFEDMVRTNVFGLLHVTQAAIPHLKRAKGMIVNVSSGLSKRALPFLAAYAGTKSMVDALSDGLRLELRYYGIKVLNYGPPEVETPFAERSRREPGLERLEAPRKKAPAPAVAEDIARAMAAEKREVVKGRSLMIMNFLAPKLVDRIFYRAMVLKAHKN